MKVMTFNTQHCKNYLEQRIDYDIMAKAILDVGADIVGLNEMRSAGETDQFEAQVAILAEKTGMPYYYFAKAVYFPNGGPYGNGILSRIPIVKAETVIIPDPNPRKYEGYYETRCVLKVELENGVTVLVSHFGLMPDEAENAVETVLSHVADQKCILMGDFNLKPDSPLLAPIFEKMQDAAEGFCADTLSVPTDKPDRKIDYIFVSRDVAVEDADIPAIVAADHRPHVATVTVKE